MPPTPLYTARDDLVAFQLRYSWTGWPSGGQYQSQPTQLIEQTVSLWELDGIRLLEFRWTSEMVQLLFSAQPHVTPVFIAARAKGRLDHAIRNSGASLPFSRKVALRSIGDNSRLDVEEYIGRQVVKERFADERWADAITEMSAADEAVDLSQPSESARGRYWYNLHLVLIVQDRFRIADRDVLRTIRDGCGKVAMKKGHLISRLSVMPDHLHIALRPEIDQSPSDVALAYQNNLAFILGQKRLWSSGFYVGTFSEYTMEAVRKAARGG